MHENEIDGFLRNPVINDCEGKIEAVLIQFRQKNIGLNDAVQIIMNIKEGAENGN